MTTDDDNDRLKFLERISRSNCGLTVKEAEFVDRVLDEDAPFTGRTSTNDRSYCDRMRAHYEPLMRSK